MAEPSFLRGPAKAALLLFNLVVCTTFASAYPLPSSPPAMIHHVHPVRSNSPPMTTTSAATSHVPTSPTTFPTLAISDANLPGLPELRSQDQQVNAALPLGGTVRGKWRVREERGPAMSSDGRTSAICTSTVVFRGFVDEPYRGIVDYDSGTCGGGGTGLRWVSKTTRVVQLSARWKVRLNQPPGKFIYKGFIDAGKVVGRGGSVSAEMTGLILTGEDSNNKVVGKFTADLVKSFDSSDVKIGGEAGGRTIGYEPKEASLPLLIDGSSAMIDSRAER